MMSWLRNASWVGAAASGLAVLLAPPEARACGGTFCDGQVPGPQQMPVDQTGENILFSIRNGEVEAHIQIQYMGDPERFGWIIPVTAKPEVGVGSQGLFDNLLAATVPTFTLTTQQQTCDGSGASIGCMADDGSLAEFGSGASTFGSGDEGDGDGDDGDGGPEIVERGFAGAFQYDILQGGTVEGVVEWLELAGYVQDDDAPPILEEYLDEGFLFVAIKLRAGVGVDEIHPVTITYPGMEPCVPIRLTRIAAIPDMAIRAFFLGESRVAPTNYAHVTLNPLRFNWLAVGTGMTGYNGAVSQAIDEAEDGQAFVTEYAGPAAVVSQSGLFDPRWSSAAFVDADWTQVIGLLESQGLLWCPGGCEFVHPLIRGLLEEFFPPPYNVDPESFWADPLAYQGIYDGETWDGPGFAAALEERIIGPGEHAIELLQAQPYLTRLFTTISPEEMTRDPLFHENPDLPDVSNQWAATRWQACEGPDWIELGDGRIVALDQNGIPSFDDMPFAETIETIPPSGAPQIDRRNSEEIDEQLAEHNEGYREVERGGCSCKSAGWSVEGLVFGALVLGAAGRFRRRR